MIRPHITFHFLLLLSCTWLLLVPTTTVGFVLVPATTTTTTTTTTILQSKTSDRAHIERHLEDSMGNDWREFRAKLIAQEGASLHKKNEPPSQPNASNNNNNTNNNKKEETKELKQHGQLSDLFGKTISNIFSGNNKNKVDHTDIFNGDSVSIQDLQTEDPFVSPQEVPLHVNYSHIQPINKHRWAHPIHFVEPGSVLIANEKLGGVFHQTVVLMIQHCDKTGSVGIVINRPLEGDLLHIANSKTCHLDLSQKLAFGKSPVSFGGPVLPEEFSILHGFGHVEGSTKLCPGVYVGGCEELMNEVRIGRLNPKQTLFVQGHAAWVPGQLSKEISKGVWYTAAVSSDLMLRYAGAKVTDDDLPNDLWTDILNCMGKEYADIARAHAGRGDLRGP